MIFFIGAVIVIVDGKKVLSRNEFIWEYLKFIRQYDLKPEQAPVLAGGGCLLLGIRQYTSDIDMDVPLEVYTAWKKSKKFKVKNYYDPDMEMLEMNHVVDVQCGNPDIPVIVVDGVGMWAPEEILKFKRSLNRPKDQDDIRGLEEVIRKQKKGTWRPPH